jgi:hypothetical protein
MLKRRPSIAKRLVLLLLPLLPAVLGACASTWQRVGEQHADFARALGAIGVKFDAQFIDWAGERVDDDCRTVESQTRDLTDIQLRQLKLYRELFCKPWSDAWDETFVACDKDQQPSGCREPMAGRIELHTYFLVLTGALARTNDSLQRYNIMAVVVAGTTPHVITEFALDRVDVWVADAVMEFLRVATPDEAIDIARSLQRTWVGIGPAIAGRFTAYVESRALRDQERRLLKELLAKRHAEE